MTTIADTVARIGPLDEGAMARAHERQRQLTKPPGSLGRLEDLAIQLPASVATSGPPCHASRSWCWPPIMG